MPFGRVWRTPKTRFGSTLRAQATSSLFPSLLSGDRVLLLGLDFLSYEMRMAGKVMFWVPSHTGSVDVRVALATADWYGLSETVPHTDGIQEWG